MGILDKFRLDGKLALVTGSATGLGAAIAVALAEAGASVACHGNRRRADETSEAIRALGHDARSFAADLSQPDGADSLYEAVFAAMGAPDIVVNNAGTIYREPAEEPRLTGLDDGGAGKSKQRFSPVPAWPAAPCLNGDRARS